MYNNILVAYDDSEFSRAALIESANWIKRHGGKLMIVHVVYFDEEEFGSPFEHSDKRIDLAKKFCAQSKEMASKEFKIEVEAIVRQGEPSEVIGRIAQDNNADLIAMGTRGRKGIKKVIMGSVTSEVIAESPCDVLVVKKPCSQCTEKYSNILIPFDNSQFSRLALDRAVSLSKLDGVTTTALYVIPRYEEMIGFMKTDSIRNMLYAEAERIIDIAKESFSDNGIALGTIIDEGNPSEGIINTAKKLNNDLIIMGSYGWKSVNRAVIGSTAERVIMYASCPVLVAR